MSNERALVVVETSDGRVEFRRPALQWRDVIRAPTLIRSSIRSGPKSLPKAARVAVYGTLYVVAFAAGWWGLTGSLVEYVLPGAAIMFGAVGAMVAYRRRPEFVIDAKRRCLLKQTGRRREAIAFDALDGIHWWHNRWGPEEDDGPAVDRFEVYAKRNDERITLTSFDRRSEAERLCAQLTRLISS